MTILRPRSILIATSLASCLQVGTAFAQVGVAATVTTPAPTVSAEAVATAPATVAAPVPVEAVPVVEAAPAAPTETPAAPAVADPAPPAPEAAKPTPPPYSLPFGMRPVVAANVIRLDNALGLYEDPVSGKGGNTVASTLLASFKVTDELAPMMRLGIASNTPPDTATDPGDGVSFLNPVVGATYAMKLSKEFRLAPFLGVALPLGSAGGTSPKPAQAQALRDGIWARSAMDNAMFAVNDLVIFPGLGFAYVSHGLTAQIDVTVLQLTRVKGNDAVQPDSSRTNFTGGVHLGYFFAPFFSFAAELRHQHWLSTPVAVKANDKLRDATTVAFGPRVHVKIGDVWFRPAVSLALPLDDIMSSRNQKNIQLDLPFAF